jgi:hypothetical protein
MMNFNNPSTRGRTIIYGVDNHLFSLLDVTDHLVDKILEYWVILRRHGWKIATTPHYHVAHHPFSTG